MKTTKYSNNRPLAFVAGILLLAACLVTSCDDELDIVPKGKTTLESLTDLESLLNQEWTLEKNPSADILMICGEAEGYALNVPGTMGMKNSLSYAYLTYDETVDREALSTYDYRYQQAYIYINYMNVLISKMPSVKGDEKKKAQCIAEARIMRAYLHWIIANIYAKQYDESTADKEGGIAYVDDIDASSQKQKLTLKETYERILEDCSDELIALLPVHEPNV